MGRPFILEITESEVHDRCQDETRFGLKPQSGKVITAKGVKLRVAMQWGREHILLIGLNLSA